MVIRTLEFFDKDGNYEPENNVKSVYTTEDEMIVDTFMMFLMHTTGFTAAEEVNYKILLTKFMEEDRVEELFNMVIEIAKKAKGTI